jgi:hypothetical protein
MTPGGCSSAATAARNPGRFTMTAKLRSRFSYANVVSTLALFMVIAGGVALGRAETQQGGPTLQQQLKVVKGLVKEVEAGQTASSQQTQGTLGQMQGKLDDVHNAVLDAHVQLGSRIEDVGNRLRDVVEPRIRALCLGMERWSFSLANTHDPGPGDLYAELYRLGPDDDLASGASFDPCYFDLFPPD